MGLRVKTLGVAALLGLTASFVVAPAAQAHVDTADEPDVAIVMVMTPASAGDVTTLPAPTSPIDWINALLHQYSDKDIKEVNCGYDKGAKFVFTVGEGNFAFTARGQRRDGTGWKKHDHLICYVSQCKIEAVVQVGPNKKINRGVVSSVSSANFNSGNCL